MNTVFILGENINGENPAVSDLPIAVTFFLSSSSVFPFLNYALHLSVYKFCDK